MCVAGDLVPSSDFVFVDRVDERLTCPICKKVLKEPWQTQCGHRFCEQCLQWLLRHEHPRCPVDGEEIKTGEVFPDRCCAREVLELPCFCRFKDRTCEWRGEFRHVQEHEATCQFGDVQCNACGLIVERRHLDEHRVDACVNREVACAFCRGDVLQSNIKDHLELCPKAPIPCILNCGADAIPRDMMEEHVTSLCPKAEVLCPFSDQGCDFKGSKEALNQHLEDKMKSHLDLMNRSSQEYNNARIEMEKKILDLENEKQAMEQQICSQIEEIAAAKQNITILQTKTSIIETSVCEHKKQMEKLRCNLESASSSVNREAVSSQMEEIIMTVRAQEQKINDFQKELRRFNTSNQKPRAHEGAHSSLSATGCDLRLDRTEHQLALHEVELADQNIRMQMIEATSYDGVYLWKIDQYSRRFQEAVSDKTPSIYSPPFYVGRFGYKVCARLYPNGDGMGKGTHMSLFFVIMRGEYDALLPWPFAQKVHIKLIDQQRIRDKVDAFRPDPNSSSFKRPSSTMNIASGFPTFISQRDLREGGYVRDDTMFIKITVDMTTLQGDVWR